MLHAVIMAGGSGTRFWPQSREHHAKQFLHLAGPRTLIQQAFDRCDGWIPVDRRWVVSGIAQTGDVREQLTELPAANLIVEPAARNTAPCIGLAAITLLQQDPDAVMLIMPADHVIQPVAAFQSAIAAAAELIERDGSTLVLLGVPPTYAATGYGYIEFADSIPVHTSRAFRVAAFREKPDAATAQSFLDAGNTFWNCGIFCWRADRILKCLAATQPEMHAQLLELAGVIGTSDWSSALAARFPTMNRISIDFAVLEQADTVCVVEAPFAWDDVGTWESLSRLLGMDDHGNTVDGLHCGVDTKNSIIRSADGHLIATLGIENCIIVHTRDATLVARRDDPEAIRRLLEEIRNSGRGDFL